MIATGTIVRTTRTLDARSAHKHGCTEEWRMCTYLSMTIPNETYGVVIGSLGGFLVVALDIAPPWAHKEGPWAPNARERAEGTPFLVSPDALAIP